MITDIRNRLIKNNSYKTVIIIFVVILAISLAIPGIKMGMGSAPWVAKVNGQDISYTDFMRKGTLQEYQLRQQYGDRAEALLQLYGISLQDFILENVVQEELLNQAARRLSLYFSDSYIAEKLADSNFVQQVLNDVIPPFLLDPMSGINTQQLKIYLRNIKTTMSDFEQEVQQSLARHVLRELLVHASYVPLFQAKDYYKTHYMGKQFSIVPFLLETFIKKEHASAISDDELRSFFMAESARNRYDVPEKRSGMLWKFTPKDYGIVITDEEIKEYYEHKQLSDYLEKPAQLEVRTLVVAIPDEKKEAEVYKKAKAIQQELIKNPDSFVEKVRELSDDVESRKKDGLLPVFAKGSQEPAFDKAAFILKKDGDISEVVRTNKGFEIIQRVSKKAPVIKPLSSVRSEISGLLLQQKFEEQFQKDVAALLENANTNKEALATFVADHKGSVKNYDAINKDFSEPAKTLFSMGKNELSSYTDASAGYLVKLSSVEPGYQPTLEDIKSVVEKDFIEQKAATTLKLHLQKALRDAKNQSLDEIGASLGLRVQKTGVIKKSDREGIKKLAEQGIPVEQVLQLEKLGAVAVFEKDGNGYLVKVEALEPLQESDFEAKKEEVMTKIAQENMQMLASGFVASLYRTATIKFNESLFQK